MITKFQIFENKSSIKKLFYSKTYECDIYSYRDVYFGFYSGGYRLYPEGSDESFNMLYYLEEKVFLVRKYTKLTEFLFGETFDEVKEIIDKYYIWKESKKYNL
jgi:hypothetical protein